MSQTMLNKREFIALEILKSLLTTNQSNAVELSFDLADEFIKTSQIIDNSSTTTVISGNNSNSSSNNLQTNPSIPSKTATVPIFNHDFPKTNKRN